jgi:leucyl aminopeptidase (aminopeptidase T)
MAIVHNIAVDPELVSGAANAIKVCLRVKRGERMTIIADNECLEIAVALRHEAETKGAEVSLFVLEEYAQRPLKETPHEILEDLAKSQVSIFAAHAQTGELGSRIQMTAVVNKQKIRHAHMVNITKEIMCEGMRADYFAVDALSTRLIEKARKAKWIKVTSPAGTNIMAEFSPTLNWLKTSGIISPDKWGNLPGGEIFTSPKNVNGTFVVDGVVGDYLCAKYGDIEATPLTIEIADSRIKRVDGANRELVDEMLAYVTTDENSNRVGEFAIGTNIGLTKIIGNILQDEKFPGIHMAFGHPYAEHTGADWLSSTHIDCVGRNYDISLEGELVMKDGKFLV